MNHRNNLLREAQIASQDYATARKQLADAKALNAMGIRTELLTLTAIEHSAFNRWKRAAEALNA